MKLIRPKALCQGDTIGVFTPSSPSYTANEEMFACGVRNLEKLGLKVKLGSLTSKRADQGYRSGTPEDRAQEFMSLICDSEVNGLISTIGGSNSNSMIPFLDFDLIREHQKVVCGYSDVTSLHLAILKFSGLRTFYGPAAMTWFGDWPDGIVESADSFWQAVTDTQNTPRKIIPFPRWSNHKRDWFSGEWKRVSRDWNQNSGWRVLVSGEVEAPIVLANLSTMMSAAGTDYFPDTKGKILMIESMSAAFASEERHLRQLHLMGVFDHLAGLIVGKPEWPDAQGAPFTHNELILEIIGKNRPYPVISEFDCSHTVPMHTIAQMTPLRIRARDTMSVDIEILESMVE
jgi:muramoyltetrapeptide carboxypeptidase